MLPGQPLLQHNKQCSVQPQNQQPQQHRTTAAVMLAANGSAAGTLEVPALGAAEDPPTTPRPSRRGMATVPPEPPLKLPQQQPIQTQHLRSHSQPQAALVQQLQLLQHPPSLLPSPADFNLNPITSGRHTAATAATTIAAAATAVSSSRALGPMGLSVSVADALLDMEASTLARELGVGSDGEVEQEAVEEEEEEGKGIISGGGDTGNGNGNASGGMPRHGEDYSAASPETAGTPPPPLAGGLSKRAFGLQNLGSDGTPRGKFSVEGSAAT
ncbi:hypothetical protein Vretifemale_17029, partial [Volvox reticuliferus]